MYGSTRTRTSRSPPDNQDTRGALSSEKGPSSGRGRRVSQDSFSRRKPTVKLSNSSRGDNAVLSDLYPHRARANKLSSATRTRARKLRSSRRRTSTVSSTIVPASPFSPSQVPLPQHRHMTEHSFVYTVLNSKSSQWQAATFKCFMSSVIIFDFVTFVLSTEPALQKYEDLFYFAEGVTSTIFLVEYIARLATITEKKKYNHYGHIMARLKFVTSFSAIIDGCATFPFFLERISSLNLPRLTYLRFFRLMRILRTSAFSKAIESLVRVLFFNREILYVAGVLGVFLVIFTSVLLYDLRPPKEHEQADNFKSLGTTMYVSTLMLTGQGGPDGASDLPWYTKCVVLLTGIFSIGMFAIPASMLTWGFEAEAQRVAAHTRKRIKKGYTSDSSSSSSGGSNESDLSTTDEEYLNIIAGEDDDDILKGRVVGSVERAEGVKALARFKSADQNGSGTITKREFVKFATNAATKNMKAQQPVCDDLERVHILARIDRLEQTIEATNHRLDRILQVLEKVS